MSVAGLYENRPKSGLLPYKRATGLPAFLGRRSPYDSDACRSSCGEPAAVAGRAGLLRTADRLRQDLHRRGTALDAAAHSAKRQP